jgi:anaerobic ribonucleoside-triphosphate reductase
MEKEKQHKIKNVRKRDGRIVEFTQEKVTHAIYKAAQSVGGEDLNEAKKQSLSYKSKIKFDPLVKNIIKNDLN